MGAEAKVLLHGQLGEDATAFERLTDAQGDDLLRPEVVDPSPVQGDLTLGQIPPMDREQATDGPQRGGLSGAVGAQQSDDLAVGHLEGHAAQHEVHVAVDDLYVLQRQHVSPASRPPPR